MARNKGRHHLERSPDESGRSEDAPVRTSAASAPQAGRTRTRVSGQPSLPPWWIRYPASVLILWHIVGLFVAPMAVSIAMVGDRNPFPGSGVIYPNLRERRSSTPDQDPQSTTFQSVGTNAGTDSDSAPTDPLALPTPAVFDLAKFYRPYLDALYLNHGYHFFAPDPGPSHVFYFTVEREEGEPIQGRFPDLKKHWPRLLYHRHFMLAEQVETVAQVKQGEEFIAIPPDSIEPLGAARAYAQHLLRANDGARVYLRLTEHKLLTPGQVISDTPINADWTYEFAGDLYEPPDASKPTSGNPDRPEEIAIPAGPITSRAP